MTDLEILEALKYGSLRSSDQALREIYRSCYKMIETMVLNNNGLANDAKDIFQDTMIIFYNKTKQEDFELSGKLSTYLYGIARNLWLRNLRDNKKSAGNLSIEGIELVSSEDINEALAFSEDQKLLAELLLKSGERCVALLKAFYFEKLKMRKITEQLNFSSEQVAKNQKAICLKKLRAILLKNKSYQHTFKLK